jgi:hypothetical protein
MRPPGLGIFSLVNILMEKSQEIPKKYICITCDYSTNNKKDYLKHKSTRKHEILTNPNEFVPAPEPTESRKYSCKCGNTYKHMSSLCNHKKKCNGSITSKDEDLLSAILSENNKSLNANLLLEIVKQTNEFKTLLIEQNNKINELASQNTMIQNNITTNNNSFNLNVFLNEKCKDALNLMDFVNSLQLKLTDFEETGRLGYVEGISQIIVNGLNQMDVHKRPRHCTDVKRETMYVKDKDVWEKENEDKSRLTKAVKMVADKNFQQMLDWQKEYPDYAVNNTQQNENFIKIMLAVLGGQTPEEDEKNKEKILRNIAKEVVIDKSTVMNG